MRIPTGGGSSGWRIALRGLAFKDVAPPPSPPYRYDQRPTPVSMPPTPIVSGAFFYPVRQLLDLLLVSGILLVLPFGRFLFSQELILAKQNKAERTNL